MPRSGSARRAAAPQPESCVPARSCRSRRNCPPSCQQLAAARTAGLSGHCAAPIGAPRGVLMPLLAAAHSPSRDRARTRTGCSHALSCSGESTTPAVWRTCRCSSSQPAMLFAAPEETHLHGQEARRHVRGSARGLGGLLVVLLVRHLGSHRSLPLGETGYDERPSTRLEREGWRATASPRASATKRRRARLGTLLGCC